jgi:GxxExxY protein
VAQDVVVEIKVQPRLTKLHLAQTISYLKTTGCEVGLVCNFGGEAPEFKRVYFNRHGEVGLLPDSMVVRPDLLYPKITYEIIRGLFEIYHGLGPGFIHRIYANACYCEMQHRGLAATAYREMTIFFKERSVGNMKLNHLLIEGCVMLFPLAIQTIGQIVHEDFQRWLADQGIQLGILTNFHSQSLKPDFIVNH